MPTVDMDVEEYRQQYLTISQDMKLIFDILNFIIIASAALIGYGFTSNNPYVFLTPFLIAIPGSYLISSNMDEIIYCAAYIVHKKESSNPQLKLCTYTYEIRKIREEKCKHTNKVLSFFFNAPTDARAYFIILTCFSGLYIYLFLNKLAEITAPELILVLILFFTQLWMSSMLLTAFTSSAEMKYLALFKEIDNKLQNEDDPLL